MDSRTTSKMKVSQPLVLLIVLCVIDLVQPSGLSYSGASGTQHNRPPNDELFYTTHSNLPHLPYLSGFFGTHGTYRFLTLSEQTAIMVGEGKHGLWRVQENGFIREYRKKGRVGLPKGLDPNAASTLLNKQYLDIIKHNYASYIPEEGFSGYKYPDQKISDGSDGIKNNLNFIDLTIYHPKYGGKYHDHVPIDLPFYYCTMSQNDFPHVKRTWDTMKAQKQANVIGPLARRAGFDIKELFTDMVRFQLFDDANVWTNVGSGNANLDKHFKNLEEAKTHFQTINFQRIDQSAVNYEIYLIERNFYNSPYLFITLIMDSKDPQKTDLTYIRPTGHYWEEVKSRHNVTGMNHVEPHFPMHPIKDYPNVGDSTYSISRGTPVFALHNPNRRAFKLTGGACPMRGGDYARYPFGNPGAGWPTNYQEVGPLCDAIVLDVKVWANLDQTWNDPSMFLANAAFNKQKINYVVDGNIYGKYTDDDLYLKGKTNPLMIDLTKDGKHVPPPTNGQTTAQVSFQLNFDKLGKHLNFNNVSAIHEVDVTVPESGKQTCSDKKDKTNVNESCMDEGTMLALLIIILVLVGIISIENICLCIYLMKNRRFPDGVERRNAGHSQTTLELWHDGPHSKQ